MHKNVHTKMQDLNKNVHKYAESYYKFGLNAPPCEPPVGEQIAEGWGWNEVSLF